MFYYTYEHDVRGRLYVVQTSLNYQGDKMARALVYFKEKSIFDLNWFKIALMRLYGSKAKTKNDLIKDFNKNEKIFINYKTNFIKFLDNSDFWLLISYCIEYNKYLKFKKFNKNVDYKTHIFISLDATCVVMQMFVLLTGASDYLDCLNLVEKKEKGIGDLYTVLITEFITKLNNSKLNKNDQILWKKIKIIINNNFLWRKILKRVFMTWNFGLKAYGVKKKIKEALIKNDIILSFEKFQFLFLNILKFLKSNKFLNKLNIILEILDQSKEKTFGDIKKLHFYIKLKGGFVLNEHKKDYIIELYYNKIEKKKIIIDRIIDGVRLQCQSTQQFKLNSLDFRKTKTALQANIEHALDATWLKGTILYCLKNNINSLGVIHDCVLTPLGDVDKVSNCFKLALKDLFKDKNQFKYLLISFKQNLLGRPLNTIELNIINNFIKKNYTRKKKIDFLNLDYVIFP